MRLSVLRKKPAAAQSLKWHYERVAGVPSAPALSRKRQLRLIQQLLRCCLSHLRLRRRRRGRSRLYLFLPKTKTKTKTKNKPKPQHAVNRPKYRGKVS